MLGNSKFAPVVVGGVIHRSQATTKANNCRRLGVRRAINVGGLVPSDHRSRRPFIPSSTTGTVHDGSIVSVLRPLWDCTRLPLIAV